MLVWRIQCDQIRLYLKGLGGQHIILPKYPKSWSSLDKEAYKIPSPFKNYLKSSMTKDIETLELF